MALAILDILFFVVSPPDMGGIRQVPMSAIVQNAHALGIALYSYANDNGEIYPDGKSSTPENVSWDVVVTADSSSPEELPLLFMTGYKVTAFAPGASAVPLVKPFPRFGWVSFRNRRWIDWLLDRPTFHWADQGGLAVSYKNHDSAFENIGTAPDGTASIPNFISPDYKPDGKTYRQLTPDGPLP